MLSIALFEILNGVTSPAAWHRDASTRDQCKFVGNGVCPSRTAWYDFRDRCGKFISELHRELVTHAIDTKLIAPHECAIDGTFTGRDKKKVLRPLYNTQIVTDCASDVIIAYDVFAQHNDNGTLAYMIGKSQNILAGRLVTLHADSGYCSILDLQDCEQLNIDLYAPVQDNTAASRKLPNGKIQIASGEFAFDESTRHMTCPGGHAMKFVKEVQIARADGRTLGELRFEQSRMICSSCPLAESCFGGKSQRRTVARQSDQKVLDEQKQKMDGERGKKSSHIRAQAIERRFADGKLHRNQDVQNGRGLSRVRIEVGLLAVAQNTLTLYLLEKRRAKVPT